MRFANVRVGVVVFIAGFVLMAMEIATGRLLAPYYGNSVFVWGSIIGVVLLALAAGYYLGGLFADRNPSIRVLAGTLIISGLWIAGIPSMYVFVVDVFSTASSTVQPLLAVLTLLLVPSVLLGFVSPYAVKLCADSLTSIGRVSGSLSAINTVGSVVGTFVATFVFMLFLSNAVSFMLLALLAILGSLILIDDWKLFLAVLFIGGLVIGFSVIDFSKETALADAGEVVLASPYGDVRVFDDQGVRFVHANGGYMSAMNLSDPLATLPLWEYFDCMEAGYIFNPSIERAAVLGGGGGVHARRLAEMYGARVDLVDINPVMVEVARDYFGLADIGRVSLHVADGRVFLRESLETYDLITLDTMHYDVTAGYQIPFQFTTQEFFSIAHDRLADDGVLVMHLFTDSDSDFLASQVRTIKTSFESVYLFSCLPCCQVLVATKDEELSKDELYGRYPGLDEVVDTCMDAPVSSSAPVLVDSYAPSYSFDELLI